LSIQNNIIYSSFLTKIKRLIFLGSSCVYPRSCKQPIKEEYLLTGSLEKTNEPYAIAKIAGIKLCESYNRQYRQTHGIDYRSVMPNNLYGSGDNYHPENSHVIPALIRKFHQAKMSNSPEVIIWGTGAPKREFLYVDDMASASVFVMEMDWEIYNQNTELMQSHLNVGSGSEITIADLAQEVAKAINYHGKINFDRTKPDGSPRKFIDSGRLNKLGWKAEIDLQLGLQLAYKDYIQSLATQ
jgi:GDP-L-fucose synthase